MMVRDADAKTVLSEWQSSLTWIASLVPSSSRVIVLMPRRLHPSTSFPDVPMSEHEEHWRHVVSRCSTRYRVRAFRDIIICGAQRVMGASTTRTSIEFGDLAPVVEAARSRPKLFSTRDVREMSLRVVLNALCFGKDADRQNQVRGSCSDIPRHIPIPICSCDGLPSRPALRERAMPRCRDRDAAVLAHAAHVLAVRPPPLCTMFTSRNGRWSQDVASRLNGVNYTESSPATSCVRYSLQNLNPAQCTSGKRYLFIGDSHINAVAKSFARHIADSGKGRVSESSTGPARVYTVISHNHRTEVVFLRTGMLLRVPKRIAKATPTFDRVFVAHGAWQILFGDMTHVKLMRALEVNLRVVRSVFPDAPTTVLNTLGLLDGGATSREYDAISARTWGLVRKVCLRRDRVESYHRIVNCAAERVFGAEVDVLNVDGAVHRSVAALRLSITDVVMHVLFNGICRPHNELSPAHARLDPNGAGAFCASASQRQHTFDSRCRCETDPNTDETPGCEHRDLDLAESQAV